MRSEWNGWVTLTDIGIQPEKESGTHELQSTSKVSALKFLQPACLCLGIFRVLKKVAGRTLGGFIGKTVEVAAFHGR